MQIRFHVLAALAAAATLGSAGAEVAVPAVTAVLDAREELLAAFDAMPEARLRRTFLWCSHESSVRVMDVVEAVPCAMAWDALLRRQYAGDLDGLLAWWRAQRDDPAAR